MAAGEQMRAVEFRRQCAARRAWRGARAAALAGDPTAAALVAAAWAPVLADQGPVLDCDDPVEESSRVRRPVWVAPPVSADLIP
jgi:hypothetical protein